MVSSCHPTPTSLCQPPPLSPHLLRPSRSDQRPQLRVGAPDRGQRMCSGRWLCARGGQTSSLPASPSCQTTRPPRVPRLATKSSRFAIVRALSLYRLGCTCSHQVSDRPSEGARRRYLTPDATHLSRIPSGRCCSGVVVVASLQGSRAIIIICLLFQPPHCSGALSRKCLKSPCILRSEDEDSRSGGEFGYDGATC